MYEMINPQSDELVLKLIRYFIKEKKGSKKKTTEKRQPQPENIFPIMAVLR